MSDEIPIGHLQRRKIEGRVLIAFITACHESFGEGPTREVVASTIRKFAVADGSRWAESFGSDMAALRRVAEEVWAGGGSLELSVIDQAPDRLDFNVPRCKYAESYKELGLADL